jgi:hypothetical protein
MTLCNPGATTDLFHAGQLLKSFFLRYNLAALRVRQCTTFVATFAQQCCSLLPVFALGYVLLEHQTLTLA